MIAASPGTQYEKTIITVCAYDIAIQEGKWCIIRCTTAAPVESADDVSHSICTLELVPSLYVQVVERM